MTSSPPAEGPLPAQRTPHASLAPDYVVGGSGATAHDLSFQLSTRGRNLVDEHNRALLLRGANVSGLNKLPTSPNGFSHLAEGFYDHETVSFVGRPFPLEEAHEHLTRLKQWGLTFLRLVITWESLEHEGPGIYDLDYIEYLHSLLSLMPKYGFKCFIDAHQDVWCRHTGGSGAPHWTLGVVGLDIRALKATGAAHAHNLHLLPSDPPPKVWPSGYCKLAAATMATVFWGGETFAPKRRVKRGVYRGGLGGGLEEEEVGLQEFLQTCMIEAFGALGDRVKDCEAVVGFEVINEPHRGYIELHSPYSWDFKTDLAIGYFPSAVQGWALGSGHSVLIDHYGPSFPVTAKTHQILLAPPGKRKAWLEGYGCLWEEHGLWAWDGKKGPVGEPVALRVEYFHKHPETGGEVDWYRDFYWPFCQKFGERIGRTNPAWNTFVGPIPNEFCPPWPVSLRPRQLIYAPHWYDLQALFSKSLGNFSANVQGLARGMFLLKALYWGRSGLKKNYTIQIRSIINAGYRSIGECPVVIGETGVPFDLNGGEAFRTGDFQWQERQMDAICNALETSLVSFNLWNYNPLNNDDWGDSWNQENFSWFGQTHRTPARLAAAALEGEDALLNVGARALDAVERPYACKIAGIPLGAHYDMRTLEYEFRFANPLPPGKGKRRDQAKADARNPPLEGEEVLARETEIYLPRRRYAGPAREGTLRVMVGEGDGEWSYSAEKQTLYFLHRKTEPGYVHSIRISVDGMEAGWMAKVGGGEVVLALYVLLVALFVAVARG